MELGLTKNSGLRRNPGLVLGIVCEAKLVKTHVKHIKNKHFSVTKTSDSRYSSGIVALDKEYEQNEPRFQKMSRFVNLCQGLLRDQGSDIDMYDRISYGRFYFDRV